MAGLVAPLVVVTRLQGHTTLAQLGEEVRAVLARVLARPHVGVLDGVITHVVETLVDLFIRLSLALELLPGHVLQSPRDLRALLLAVCFSPFLFLHLRHNFFNTIGLLLLEPLHSFVHHSELVFVRVDTVLDMGFA